MTTHLLQDMHADDRGRLDVAVDVLDTAACSLRVIAAGCDDQDVTEYLNEIADDVQQHVTDQIKSARACLDGEPHCRQLGYRGMWEVGAE